MDCFYSVGSISPLSTFQVFWNTELSVFKGRISTSVSRNNLYKQIPEEPDGDFYVSLTDHRILKSKDSLISSLPVSQACSIATAPTNQSL